MKTLIAATLLALPLLAQTHSESITVEVVDVPVYVYNANGAVQNLKKDDFELYVNGKPQSIDYFDPIDFRAPAKTEAAAAPAPVVPRDTRDRRLFLLILDSAHSRPAAIDRARKAAAAMIEASAPSDYFSVATYTAKRGLDLLVPFTNDHTVALRAALSMKGSSVHDPLAISISATERENADLMAGTISGGADERAGADVIATDPILQKLVGGAAADNALMPAIRMIEDQLQDFGDIAKRLGAFEGYKHVILMSGGFSPTVTYREPRLMTEFRAMANAFRGAGAVVDAIDLGGTVNDTGFRKTFENDALHLIASETGGHFIQHENNLKNALNEISTASAVGYRLGFNMPKNAKKGDNTIDVKVRNVPRGTTLSFRRGFSTTISKPSPDDGLRLADIILNDMPQNGVPPRIVFAERPYVEIVVPAQQLLAVNGGKPVNADVMLYVFDDKHAVVEFKDKKVVIPSDAKRDIALRDALDLKSGSYTIKALLRAGDSVGFTKQDFAIPTQAEK
ncbi:MAG TPA: VWA domain-containing protein [Thermoanaerobaculia bacterium]|nr:VWA domain-containing protein [Thermoanaerobaculia bacterium]